MYQIMTGSATKTNELFGLVILIISFSMLATYINQPYTINGQFVSREISPSKKTATKQTSSIRKRSEYPRKNVLFLIADDMRAQLGCYNDNQSVFNTVHIQTPNLDRLAARSLLLKEAYVQYTLCGPSRTSILTSRRPDVTGVFTNNNYWRNLGHNFTTLPQYFKENGYESIRIGKVFHKFEDDQSWTTQQRIFSNPEKMLLDFKKGGTWMSYTKEQSKIQPLLDTLTAQAAIEHLSALSSEVQSGQKNFFMAVGFNKPHLSFVCPEELFKFYPLETNDQYLYDKSWQTPIVKEYGGFLSVTRIGGQFRMTDSILREYRRAYFACISYTDDLIGQLLGALDKLGLSESTIISFVSDHGYHLGENGHVGKKLLTDTASHVPMMLHIPSVTDQGIKTDSIVEALDLFPTLAEAAGLNPIPRCTRHSYEDTLCTQGRSLLPLIKDPRARPKSAAFTQLLTKESNSVAYSMRSSRYRYTEYFRLNDSSDITNSDFECLYSELFDHDIDIQEATNRTDNMSYMDIKRKLKRKLANFIKMSTNVHSNEVQLL